LHLRNTLIIISAMKCLSISRTSYILCGVTSLPRTGDEGSDKAAVSKLPCELAGLFYVLRAGLLVCSTQHAVVTMDTLNRNNGRRRLDDTLL